MPLRAVIEHAIAADPLSTEAITTRVFAAVALGIAPSPITGAGTGVFTKESVTANSLIFKIDKPLLNIVSSWMLT